jgi:hypothetical protein
MEVEWLPEAEAELTRLPEREQAAVYNAVALLRVEGVRLGAPHTSAVLGASEAIRELRPRRGRSPWRVFYRRVGDTLVLGSVGPEAEVDPRRFRTAVETAIARLRLREGRTAQ